MNAYEMLELLRDNVGEITEKHWKDKLLLSRLNVEHRLVGRMVAASSGDWLLKKSSLITASNSLITLPSDCLAPAYIEETNGRPITISGTVRERNLGRLPATGFTSGRIEGYLFGNYVEVNKSGYGEQVYVWYQPRIIDLHAGECGNATGATSIVFEAKSWPNGQDDYYNGSYIEVRDSKDHILNVRQEITDYDGGTFAATIASSAVTPAVNDFYGTVSVLPDELHGYVVLRATLKALAKPSSTFEKEVWQYFRALMKEAKEEVEEFLSARISDSSYVRIVEDDY